ncbi:extracellular solute-binding protein [Alteromonas oceanisediminis]|uniref:extracellular solute-binding protein n=1 Tax=Alteromonas oceanisediminis TaxID=2836180 RepID=UPI001BDB3A5A|nr:extracellular solute-binding protein [Alteromonas oceanisediminis]MBT0587547.1 extracellular solute-binding protein [Alteromonas oceanisediminis]
MKLISMLLVATTTLSGFAASNAVAQSDEVVNVYSARKEALIKPLLDQFTESTGIEVNLVTGNADALISRMQSEGQFSPVDILLTTDAGRLVRAQEAGLTQAIQLDVLTQGVPAHLRDEAGHWYALTKRARPLMINPNKVDKADLTSIFDLAKPHYKDQICVRSSSNIYNQSMVAALVLDAGKDKVENWAEAVVDNMARSPKGGDRDQIKAVAAGQCSIAIANTYYLAGMLSSDDPTEKAQAEQVEVVWTDQDSFGTHINISGAAVAKHAPNKDAALQLMAFMITPESQQWYAQQNHEYPVLEGVEWSPLMQAFGEFKPQSVSLKAVGKGNAQALMLMDRAGWK